MIKVTLTSILRSLAVATPMISSRDFSLMRKQFFPAPSRSFGTFSGHENRNVIHSFKVPKPWGGNYMLRSEEIPKGRHRLSFFISYSKDVSASRDFPTFVGDGSNVKVKLSPSYKWIEPTRNICYRQIVEGSGDVCVEDGKKVKIHYMLYDETCEVRYSTYSKRDPEVLGPDTNKICQGLYEGIVGMRREETRRIVVPPSSVLTGNDSKSWWKWNSSADSKKYRIYDVHLVEIIP